MSNRYMGICCCDNRDTTVSCKCGCGLFYCLSCYEAHCVVLVEKMVTKTDQQTFLEMTARAGVAPDETFHRTGGDVMYAFVKYGKCSARLVFNNRGELKSIFGYG